MTPTTFDTPIGAVPWITKNRSAIGEEEKLDLRLTM